MLAAGFTVVVRAVEALEELLLLPLLRNATAEQHFEDPSKCATVSKIQISVVGFIAIEIATVFFKLFIIAVTTWYICA